MPAPLFLPGSLPCETAEQSFRVFGGALGEWLSYMPDGEVGTRRYWVDGIAYRVYNGHPEIETTKYPEPEKNGVEKWWPRGRTDEFGFRVRPGVQRVRFGDPGWRLGFARDAINSYALFHYMKKDGIIPQRVRFQVCIPLTYSAVGFFFPDGDVEKVTHGVTEALRAEVAKIVELIPNDDLAIQWDLAVENRVVDTALEQHGTEAAKEQAARMCAPARAVCAVLPKEVHLGYHTCFGTLNGWPTRQPATLAGTVTLANAAVAASSRKVDFLHIPTLASAEDAFFSPLGELQAAGTHIYMGSIHHLQGPGGLLGQLRTIKKFLPEFGLGSPCGFGRTADRQDRLITDDGSKVPNPIEVILNDHRKAVTMLHEVLSS